MDTFLRFYISFCRIKFNFSLNFISLFLIAMNENVVLSAPGSVIFNH